MRRRITVRDDTVEVIGERTVDQLLAELARMDADLAGWASAASKRTSRYSWDIGSPQYRSDFAGIVEELRGALEAAEPDAARLERVRRVVRGQGQDPVYGWQGRDAESDPEDLTEWDDSDAFAPRGVADAVHRIEAVLELPTYDIPKAVRSLESLAVEMQQDCRESEDLEEWPVGRAYQVTIDSDRFLTLSEEVHGALAEADDAARLRSVLVVVAELRRAVAECEYKATLFIEGWGDETTWAYDNTDRDVLLRLEQSLRAGRIRRPKRVSQG